MNDDIKEILDKLEIVSKKHTIEVCDDGSKIETMSASIVDELRLNNWSAKLLLDYITNLQQENEELKKNQRFHKKCGNDYIFCVEGDKETYKDLLLEKQEELEDYKSRCEKAVEYIENDDNFWVALSEDCGKPNDDLDKLLNILNGKE